MRRAMCLMRCAVWRLTFRGTRLSGCAIFSYGYFTIDLDIVWDAVQQDVPLLKPAVVALLKQLETQA